MFVCVNGVPQCPAAGDAKESTGMPPGARLLQAACPVPRVFFGLGGGEEINASGIPVEPTQKVSK